MKRHFGMKDYLTVIDYLISKCIIIGKAAQ